jgi:hypothetical protein
MIYVTFPDQLVWQAGIEYGLQAAADAFSRGAKIVCYLRNSGPMLEAVAFAVREFGLHNVIRWGRGDQITKNAHVFLFPRVKAMESETIYRLISSGKTVITSDPNIKTCDTKLITFQRRDYKALSDLILGIACK